MKFLANMGISPLTVAFLRELGYKATHLHEEALDRLPDSEILNKARAEKSIILTSDLDFGDLLAASKAELPSVIIFRLSPPMTADKVNAQLAAIIEKHSTDLVEGVVISVSDQRIRV